MIGTMVLVLMGCGSAVFAGSMAGTVGAGVGTVGVALAFGLSVVAMAYAIGGISGCHINPAITLGVFLSGRMNGKDAGMYMLFQVIGAILGSAILYALVTTGGYDGPTATGSNGFGDGEMLQAFIAEVVFTFIFVLVVLGSTDPKKGAGAFAGLAIGLSLVLVHIVCIPITGMLLFAISIAWYWCISYVSLLQVLPSIRHVASVRHCSRVEKRCRSYGCLLWRRL